MNNSLHTKIFEQRTGGVLVDEDCCVLPAPQAGGCKPNRFASEVLIPSKMKAKKAKLKNWLYRKVLTQKNEESLVDDDCCVLPALRGGAGCKPNRFASAKAWAWLRQSP